MLLSRRASTYLLGPALPRLNPALPRLNPALPRLNPALTRLNPALALSTSTPLNKRIGKKACRSLLCSYSSLHTPCCSADRLHFAHSRWPPAFSVLLV